MAPRLWLRSLFWRKTLEDLFAEMNAGQRRMISRDEMVLAKAYERRTLPKALRFPREGEIYESIETVTINYATAHHRPYTGGGDAVLPKGERVCVCKPIDDKPLGVYCHPLRYDELHESIVPAEERENKYYENYYFSIDTIVLNKSFRLMDDDPEGASLTNFGS